MRSGAVLRPMTVSSEESLSSSGLLCRTSGMLSGGGGRDMGGYVPLAIGLMQTGAAAEAVAEGGGVARGLGL